MFTIWLKILTFIVFGFILLLIELFTPTFGIVGISGIILIIVGCYLAGILQSLTAGIILSLASLIIIVLIIKLFPKTKIAKSLRLNVSQDKEVGYHSADKNLKEFLGKGPFTELGEKVFDDYWMYGCTILQKTWQSQLTLKARRIRI